MAQVLPHDDRALIVLHVKELLFKTKKNGECIREKKRHEEKDRRRRDDERGARTRNENQINALECFVRSVCLHDSVFGIQIKRL